MSEIKFIFDPIYGYIKLSSLAITIIDTPEFQRLRSIKQLGLGSLVFETATHTRFSHSIGVYHLAGVVLDIISKNHPNIQDTGLTWKVMEMIKLAGLCHDLGHGPFSHLFDDILLGKSTHPNRHHEKRSLLITEMIIKRELSDKLDEKDILFIQNCIDPQKEHSSFLYQIVSNKLNSFDVDKFDYLMRDAQATGIQTDFDYRRVVGEMRIDKNLNLCYPKQIVYAAFNMFKTRYEFHKIIYRHKTSQSIEMMFADIFSLIDPIFHFSQTIQDMNDFCQLTDNSVIDILELYGSHLGKRFSPNFTREELESLEKAQTLWKMIKQRDIYTFLGELINLDINANYLLSYDETGTLKEEDFVILKYKIGYISGKHGNPIEHIYFYDPKRFDGTSFIINKKDVSSLITENYQESYVKIFCKNPEKLATMRKAFFTMSQHLPTLK